MKLMAGAKPEAKPDYRAQTLAELAKLQQKVVLLNEMLDNVDAARGERFVSGDAYHQVSLILVQARPKIQKWIGNAETDDPESLENFLQINDQINIVLGRYEAFKQGDYSAAANPVPPELSSSSKAPAQKADLINLLEDEPAPAPATGPMNELADLFGPGPSSSTAPTTPPQQTDARANIMAAFQSPSHTGGAIALPGTPKPQGANPDVRELWIARVHSRVNRICLILSTGDAERGWTATRTWLRATKACADDRHFSPPRDAFWISQVSINSENQTSWFWPVFMSKDGGIASQSPRLPRCFLSTRGARNTGIRRRYMKRARGG